MVISLISKHRGYRIEVIRHQPVYVPLVGTDSSQNERVGHSSHSGPERIENSVYEYWNYKNIYFQNPDHPDDVVVWLLKQDITIIVNLWAEPRYWFNDDVTFWRVELNAASMFFQKVSKSVVTAGTRSARRQDRGARAPRPCVATSSITRACAAIRLTRATPDSATTEPTWPINADYS